MNPTLKQAGLAVLGGAVAAISVAIPLVDDGMRMSEVLSIALAGLVGTGLTAAPVVKRAPKNTEI